jgi:regulator of protease activity HflC (stomatin/prohibitin superfamily)
MFDKLIQFLLEQINNIIPIATIHQYQNGVLYKFGKYAKTLNPGWHFKFPYINTYSRINTVDTTMLLPAISVTTNDNKQFIVRGSIGYRIIDVAAYFNNVYDAVNALSDRGCVILRETAMYMNSQEFRETDLNSIVYPILQNLVEKYGIELIYFSLISLTEGRSYRIFHESISTENL